MPQQSKSRAEREQQIETLRQAYCELDFECSPTADELGDLIFELAREWGVELKPRIQDGLIAEGQDVGK
jgi:hypothetical protein